MTQNLVAEIAARLAAAVEVFEGRVLGVQHLAQGIERTMHRYPGCYVVPLGHRTSPALTGSGAHRQTITWRTAVVVVTAYADDAHGAQQVGEVATLTDEVLAALAGWTPDPDVWAPLAAGPGDLVSAEDGVVAVQVSFTTESELRISA